MSCLSVRARTPWHPVQGLWLAAAIFAFTQWWPLGLALMLTWKAGSDLLRSRAGWLGPWGDRTRLAMQSAVPAGGTGNLAFDAHRDAVLRRLEEERRALETEREAFAGFMQRLRRAKDQEEFDRFMSERGRSPEARIG